MQRYEFICIYYKKKINSTPPEARRASGGDIYSCSIAQEVLADHQFLHVVEAVGRASPEDVDARGQRRHVKTD